MTFFHPPHQMIFQIGVTLHFWNYQQDNLPDDYSSGTVWSSVGWMMTALHICLRMLFWARRANKLLGVGFLSCSDCHSFGHLGTFAPWERQSVKQNQTRNYGMFSFDRGVCVCEQVGIWLPTNPNFAATCSSPVWSYSPRQTVRTSTWR